MTRRYRPPRLTRRLPAGQLEAMCSLCGFEGAWDYERGVVLHKFTPTCHVQVPVVVDEQEAEAA